MAKEGASSRVGRFDLVIRGLPRTARVRVGLKGVVEVELDRIPEHLFTGEDGLFLEGLSRVLENACSGSGRDIRRAEQRVEAWYNGYRKFKGSGLEGGAPARPGAADRLDQARRVFERARAAAIAVTGDEGLAGKPRREVARKVGAERFAEFERMAREQVEREAGGSATT